MTTETAQFESTVEFQDDPPEQVALTPEQEFEKSFEENAGDGGNGGNEPQAPAKRLYETMSDEELKDVFDKARQVDQINERLKSNHDATFGRIGGIEQALKELRSQTPTAANIDKAALKNLTEYLGEDDEGLLDALAKDLSTLQLGIPLTPDFDGDARFAEETAKFHQQQQAYDNKLTELRREFEVRMLSIQHPDWEEINTVPEQTKEFVDWQLTLRPEDRKTLEEASQNWDAKILSGALSKFKDWKGKKTEFEQNKNQRLQDNLVPTRGNGAARPPPNFDNDYEREFQKALNG